GSLGASAGVIWSAGPKAARIAATTDGGNLNFGRNKTCRYSTSICEDHAKRIFPLIAALRIWSQFPPGVSTAETRTLVSITQTGTFMPVWRFVYGFGVRHGLRQFPR